MEQNQQKGSFGKIVSALLLVSIIAGSAYGVMQRQQISDYLILRNYSPPQEVIALADVTTMRDATRKVFYVNRPELNDKSSFKTNCPTTEHSIVLGCYVQNNGIYLLKVDDPRLEGVEQVTAAHEILHAEYDRLSKSERTRVDGMTSAFFATLQNDRIKKNVEQYRAKDPSVVPNELHSILATEVRNLSPELEQYYGQFFSDRSKIVEFSENYEKTFVDLNNQVERYDKELDQLKQDIESSQLKIDALASEVEQEKAQLESLASRDTEAYNDAVPGFNAKVRQYNSLIEQARELVTQHNELVEKRNAIVTTEQELVQAIDTNTITPKETE